jgi:hypothetical protein
VAITTTYNRGLSALGMQFTHSETVSSDLAVPFSVSCAAAKTGSLTTRTDDNTGTLTMATGHAIPTGQRLDVFWDGGARVGMTVGTVSGLSVPIDLGSGDVLPAAATAVTAQVPSEEALVVTGDDAVLVACGATAGGAVTFTTSGDVYVFHAPLTSLVTSYVWNESDGGTNPLAGASVAKAYLSNSSSAAAGTVNGIVQYD